MSFNSTIVPSMANVGESISRAPSFQKILTERMVWPGSDSHHQAELVRHVKNLHGRKFGCRDMYVCILPVFSATNSELIRGRLFL